MSNGKYYDELLAYLTEHGETGVNILAKELNVPLSTMQRYLEKQYYFRKTVNRKWDLPDSVNSGIQVNTATLAVDSVESAVKLSIAQMSEMQLTIQNSLMLIQTLKRNIVVQTVAPVAKSVDIDTSLVTVDTNIKNTYVVFKKYIKVVPEMYRELLLNLDLYRLTIEMGTRFTNSDFNTDISSLLLEKTDELPEETIEILKEYQKE